MNALPIRQIQCVALARGNPLVDGILIDRFPSFFQLADLPA